MGNRVQCSIQEYKDQPKLYLYSHWKGRDVIEDVRNALKREERWDDYEYLARIIFEEMIKDDIGSATGYGISTAEHGDNELLIQILPDQTIKVGKTGVQTFKDFAGLDKTKVPEV